MMIRNRAFIVNDLDHSGVVVLRLFDANKHVKEDVYNACFSKYGFEPTSYTEIDIDSLMISDLSVGELKLILKYD